ncbi:MAG TPA: hypothetical protein EYN91_24435 [Candidatus Melainabacteria bacterium]|jgi:hypothetical protein|nr:hypothetical protein [Candidatus Melainabacteria bacterium]HIN63367.1 hypothetical protein [Candidatus Obscuribacterales bacterium]
MPFPSSGESKDVSTYDGGILADASVRRRLDQENNQSYLDIAVHTIFDPLTRLTTKSDKYSEELTGYTKGFIKSLPLFMKGRLPLAGLLITYAADEAKTNDSIQNQLLDAGLGSSKGLLLKGTFRALGGQGVTPGMTGVGIGITSRITDTALSRANYIDSDQNFNLSRGLQSTLSAGFNPKALAMDAITFAASDVLWARIMNNSRGTAWYRPEITHAISGGTMGLTSEFGNELHRQVSAEGHIDTGLLMQRSLTRGAFDALAGGLGGLQTRRYGKLIPAIRDSAEVRASARATPFQKGLLADSAQVALRDGTFILDKKLPSLTTETWVGWTHTSSGEKIRSVFRPSNGTEAFAHRMQSEIAAYGLQTLGLKMAVPVTVARKVEIGGKTYSGYIQEMEGVSLAAFAKKRLGNDPSRRNLQELLQSKQSLHESYSNAWLHRMIFGEWDNHALNMTVNKKNPGAPQVRNIDLGDSLRPAESLLDVTPTPGVRQGYDKINARLYRDLAGKKLDSTTLSYLKDIQSRFSTPLGRSNLLSIGMTPQQTDGVLGRINWLVKNERMPVGKEALFYLHLNDARRAFERFYGKAKAQSKDDQTNYFE